MTNTPRVCVPKLLTEEQQAAAVSAALKENPDNRQGIRYPQGNGETLAVEVDKRWANGKVLHVRFLNGDDIQKAKCELNVHKWEAYANVKFVFDNSPNAEIRVAFYDASSKNPLFGDQGSWSYIGTDCLTTPKDEQTVNFGWLDKTTENGEWTRVVVHEFGHVLGCDHEDQQPEANIPWNKPAVYSYFEGPPNNWTKDDVDTNVINRTPSKGIAHTDFDPESIMAYAIPPEFTLNHVGIPGGVVLSDADKALISQMYPFGLPNGVTPTLVPGGPAVNAVINSSSTTSTFPLTVKEAGTYRVWTSFMGGIVSVTGPDGKTASHALQVVTFDAKPGIYSITVTPQTFGATAYYRIIVRKIR